MISNLSHEPVKKEDKWDKLIGIILKLNIKQKIYNNNKILSQKDKETIKSLKDNSQKDIIIKNALRSYLTGDSEDDKTLTIEELIGNIIPDSKKRFDALKLCGISTECRFDETIPKLIDALGIPSGVLDIPKGITHELKKAEELINRAESAVKNNDGTILTGACVDIFKILEKIFQELLYIYTSWRFNDNSSETLFTVWVKDKKYQDSLRNDQVTLGTFKNIFNDIDNFIKEDDKERKIFVDKFGRENLIFRLESVKKKYDVQLPDFIIIDYESLSATIKDRNVIIHYKPGIEVDGLKVINKVYEFIKYLKEENIFPIAITQKSYARDFNDNLSIEYLDESNKINTHKYAKKPLEFKCEYYRLKTYPEAKYIKKGYWRKV